jgi:hypothetical protein
MMRKRVLIFLLLAMILSILAAEQVLAGCCIGTTAGSGCSVDTNGACGTGENYTEDSCSLDARCAKGCCCGFQSTSGIGNFNFSCALIGGTFYFNSSISINDPCTCGVFETYPVSGTVRDKLGSPLAMAHVSALSVTNTSNSNGNFSLANVPGGNNVPITAVKLGCSANTTTIPFLNESKTNVQIRLNCGCSPKTCNATTTAYCNSAGSTWDFYDITNLDQMSIYCGFCRQDDSINCNVASCKGGDGECPLTCSNDPSNTTAYDSDCVCNLTVSNGVCPLGCTNETDVDCNITKATCGNGKIEYPYETCEENVTTGVALPGSFCSADKCGDRNTNGQCNCIGLSGCGNLILEAGEECEANMICSDASQCVNCKCGQPPCAGTNLNPAIKAAFNPNTRSILINWSVVSPCNTDVMSYSLFRCQKNSTGACSNKTEFSHYLGRLSNERNYTDSGSNIQQLSEYCYYVKVSYWNFPEGESAIACAQTGNSYCMNTHPPEFCMNNARSICDASNNIKTITGGDCNPNKFCVGPNRDGITECLNLSVCDFCNGLYGAFSNLNLAVKVPEGGYSVTKYCYSGESGMCYLDRTKNLFSEFNYCGEINSCYDFKSEVACRDPLDPCNKNQGCEWNWLDDNNHILGGICRPSVVAEQNCELCDNNNYNWLSAGCTPEACSLFGKCFYQGKSSSLINAKSCTSQRTVSCLDYPTQQACTGGRPVVVDATYSGNVRTNGTHQLTPSQDTLGLGKCYWVGGNVQRCYRNADNNLAYDCRIGDRPCEADFSSPETKLAPPPLSGLFPANVRIAYSVTDNSPPGSINTSFCITDAGTTCYPNNLAAGGVYSQTLTSSGDYTVYYYSQDPAKNLEIVKSTPITVDAVPPFIDIISPANTSSFQTNQQTVEVKGNTSLDSKFVCYNNTATGRGNCTRNCALVSNRQPCFSDLNGIFTLNVTLGTNVNAANITFYAEDFAGNTYRNTLLGILLDINPPSLINITVEAVKI